MDTTYNNCSNCHWNVFDRCTNSYHCGEKVSSNMICSAYTYEGNLSEIRFDTLGQLENYLRENFYRKDFVTVFTRKQLSMMLKMLYPYADRQNLTGRAFTSMCKKRMVKHIEFYVKLHDLT